MIDEWLEERVDPSDGAGEPTLVLCRTAATVRTVRSWAARRGGAPGLDVSTPSQLAKQLAPQALLSPQPIAGEIPEHPILRRIQGRPALLALARQRVREFRLNQLADSDLRGPPWLEELATTAWDVEHEVEAALLQRARARGLELSPTLRWDRVVSIGFGCALDPWTRGIHSALTGMNTLPAPPEAVPSVAFTVPDPAAEARFVAAHAIDDPQGTLVLVHHESTAVRVHRALVRNGVPSAWRGPARLGYHPLVSLLHRVCGWFDGDPDPTIHAIDLRHLLQRSPVHEVAPRDLGRVIRRTRLIEAPLSRWLSTLERLEARAVHTQALGIADCVSGQLQGGPGTLGALVDLVHRFRLEEPCDPTTDRILAAMLRSAELPATPARLEEAVAGIADRGEIRSGVEIMTYDDYDGRPSRTLLLCDVHDRGVSSRPAADPLLSVTELDRIGVLHGTAHTAHRLDQLRRAVAASSSAMALIAQTDAMGRAVVPPVQLQLQARPAPTGAYGLELDSLVENQALHILRAQPTTGAPTPPEPGPLCFRSIQATLEWSRAGRGPIGNPPRTTQRSSRSTLAHLLVNRPTPPHWLMPWLGGASDVPEAFLPDREYAVGELFGPITHCLYQSFIRLVLDIRAPEPLVDELDSGEVRRAVQAVLRHSSLLGATSTRSDLASVREAFHDRLVRNTSSAFEAVRAGFGWMSPSRQLAADGLQQRWNTHWKQYAARRTQRAVDEVEDQHAARDLVYDHRWVDTAASSLRSAAHSAGLDLRPKRHLMEWIRSSTKSTSYGSNPMLLTEHELCFIGEWFAVPTQWAPTLRSFVQSPEYARVVQLWRVARAHSTALRAPVLATVTELPFGTPDREGVFGDDSHSEPIRTGPLTLQLGEQELDLRGLIDRVSVVGSAERPLLRVLRYTTVADAPAPRTARRQIIELIEPQLIVQVLALKAALEAGLLPKPMEGSEIATVGWDHVRAIDEQRRLRPALDRVVLDPATTRMLARALGSLIGHARGGNWPLSPRADSCPAVSSWSNSRCPAAGACRLQAVDGPQ